ncbi:MAG TPA: hypothetical protein VNA04_09230 [Thermoanaerobaculia bacterium]|nr:hypothetical protein [Thermoanaerobaculia bacterium]
MDQDTPTTTGFGASTGKAGTAPGTTSAAEVCEHCGQPLGGNRGLEQFLAKIGITNEMIEELKVSMQNVDLEEYLNTTREYLKTASDKMKTGGEKAKAYTKEHPGKVAAGVAVLAVGAGLLINALSRER